MGFGGSGYAYEPAGRVERLEGVRIGIWSTKCFSGRWDGPAPSMVVEPDLRAVGTDRLEGTITNRLDVPLRDAIVAFGDQVYYQVGTIEPGAAAQVDRSNNRVLANYIGEDLRKTYLPNNPYETRTERINRPNLAVELMFHDSDRSGQEPVPSRALHDLDLSGQLALGRPMLVARIDRPAARLVLGNAPGAAKIDQTTMVRVILPLQPEAKAGTPSGR